MLGWFCFTILLPIGFLFYRSKPEIYGLQPDNKGKIVEVDPRDLKDKELKK